MMVTIMGVKSQAPGPSWRDLAMRYQTTGQSDSALYYLEKWTQADPGDEISWYNLACLRALAGHADPAFDALENAIAAGWNDADHTLEDPDLISLRGQPRFGAAMEKMRSRGKADGPVGYIRRYLENNVVGTYIVMLPPDYDSTKRDYPVCVILHGAGSTENAHGRLSDQVGREGVIYIAPRAPYAVPDGSGKLGYTSYLPERIDSTDPLYGKFPNAYSEWIMSCVADARKHYRIDSRPATILGHSQGAAMSMITAALYPEQVRAVFAYAGYFPEDFRTEHALDALKARGVHFALAHGRADNVVPPDLSIKASDALKVHGIDATLTMYDSTSHGITKPVLQQMRQWVDTVVGRAH